MPAGHLTKGWSQSKNWRGCEKSEDSGWFGSQADTLLMAGMGGKRTFAAPARVTAFAKDIGHRQVYDILQCRNPRATGGGLWGFGLFAAPADGPVSFA